MRRVSIQLNVKLGLVVLLFSATRKCRWRINFLENIQSQQEMKTKTTSSIIILT
jgi:hypothetical protein